MKPATFYTATIIGAGLFLILSFTFADTCKCVPERCQGTPVCLLDVNDCVGKRCWGCKQYSLAGPCQPISNANYSCTDHDYKCGGLVCGNPLYAIGVGWYCTTPTDWMKQCTEPVFGDCGGAAATGTACPEE